MNTKTPNSDAERVRDISEAVYKMRLEDTTGGGECAIARMIAKDKDTGEKLRNRAGAYDTLTRCYLRVFGAK